MSASPALPSYTEVTNALKKTPGKFNGAQVHGLICGLICTNPGRKDDSWKAAIVGNKKDAKVEELLQQLYENSYHQMTEFSFEFMLLLPDDDVDINLRAETLGLWCMGFLTGLEQARAEINNRASEEINEALNDMTEISQVNYEEVTSTDEDETAYFELVEYVRLAALMIFHELRSNPPGPTTIKSNLLH